MYTIDSAISTSISGGNQSASGAKPSADAISVIECATVNDVTIAIERPNLPERNDEAEDEQQVVDAVENVREAERDEPQRRLMPARIEPHQARIADVLERALGAAGGHEAQHRRRAHAEPRERRLDREARRSRRDRILEHDVEHRLLPHELGRRWRAARPVTWASARRRLANDRSDGSEISRRDDLGRRERASFS